MIVMMILMIMTIVVVLTEETTMKETLIKKIHEGAMVVMMGIMEECYKIQIHK